MQGLKRKFSGNGAAVKFALLESLFWLAIAVGGYQSVFMRENGFTASMVGTVNAAANLVSIIAGPFWGMICDKLRSVKKVTILLFLIGGVLLYLVFPATANITLLGTNMIAFMIPFMAFFRYPFFTLLDNWLIQSSHKKGLNFGPIRAMGSLAYALGGFLMSAILPFLPLKYVFLISTVIFVFVILVSTRIEDVHHSDSEEKAEKKSLKELKVGRLFKNYYYIIFLIYYFTFNLVLNSDTNFVLFMLEDVGAGSAGYSITIGFRALIEIPILFGLPWLRKRFSYYKFSVWSAIILGIGMILIGGLSTSLLHVLLFSIFTGIATGANIGSAASYVYELAPTDLKATAHTIFSAVGSVASVLGNLVGGQIIDALGAKTYYVLLGAFLLVSVVVYIGLYWTGQKRGKKEFEFIPLETDMEAAEEILPAQ